MLYERLVQTSDAIARTPGRRAKIEALASLLRELDTVEVPIGVSHLSGQLRQGRIGLGPAALDSLDGAYAPRAMLSLRTVDAAFTELAETRGAGSGARRQQLLRELFARATKAEQSFLRRLVLGELRQGALDGVMADAIARASGLHAAEIRRAIMLAGDTRAVAIAVLSEGAGALGDFDLLPGRAVRPMLASPVDDLATALQLMPEALIDYKLDGVRVQVHRYLGRIEVFTRNLNEIAARVPEVLAVIEALPMGDMVLDGELLALREDGRPHPFQVTMSRFGRRGDSDDRRRRLPLRLFAFDCLYWDRPLIDRDLRERVSLMQERLPAEIIVPRLQLLADHPHREQVAEDFIRTAQEVGHEGVMIKSLQSTYQAGSRGAAWLKLKQAHTLDLVVLAAEWGSGRRRGWLSNLHLGARSEDGRGFVMLGKTF
ncbi:MAG: ATP-dependent DNA ligase, partial [Gammaproteobacteria bacterium]|nr:ATP-dependent DNA ligase [Gammaproteobacteria bacterium]